MAKFRGKDVCFSPKFVFTPDESDATATAEDIAQGKTAYVDNVKITGTMATPSGNQDIDTLDEYNVTTKATARVSAAERAKIIPENIAQGVTILGVTGTHQGGGAKPYITFSSPTNFTLAAGTNGKTWDGSLYYSTDLATWTLWNGTSTLSSVDGKLYLYGVNNTKITGADASTFAEYSWVLTGTDISCDGDIRCLLDYTKAVLNIDPTMADYAFAFLFYNNANLIKSPAFPAMTLSKGCYKSTLRATGITISPELPATTLVDECYQTMMYDCASLAKCSPIKAVVIPDGIGGTFALTGALLATFHNCTALNEMPSIKAVSIGAYACSNMFRGCQSIKISETQSAEYPYEYRIPATGTGSAGNKALLNMFSGTGGTFTGTPSVNTTYYTSNEIIS